MRGLDKIPDLIELERAYASLKGGLTSELDIALYSQWARLDPRLAEIWVASLAQVWRKLNPVNLRALLVMQPWPNAAAVLLEFARLLIPVVDHELFACWRELVVNGMAKAHDEQFFMGQRSVGGKLMELDATYPLMEYERWGFLAREVPINKAQSHMIHRSRKTRLRMLRSMLAESSRITTTQYLEAVGGGISRRQAERDLESTGLLRAIGNTKARVYLRKGRT